MNEDDNYYDLDGNKICDKNGYTNELHVIDINDDKHNEDYDDNVYHSFYIDNLHGAYFQCGNVYFDIEGRIYNDKEEINDSYIEESNTTNKIYDDNENKVYMHETNSNIHYIDKLFYVQNIFKQIMLYLFHKIQFHFNSIMYYIYRRDN